MYLEEDKGVKREYGQGSKRVAVKDDTIDDDDNRYPGTQHIIMTDGSIDGVDDEIQSFDVTMGSGRNCLHSHLEADACWRTKGLCSTTHGFILTDFDD